MIKKLNKLVLHSLHELYFSVVPTVVPFGILEFCFFRISTSKSYCCCLPVVLSKKEEIYFNFRVLHTEVKLFNSFLCKTSYSELLKELFNYYINILSLFKRNTFNYFGRTPNVFTSFRQV